MPISATRSTLPVTAPRWRRKRRSSGCAEARGGDGSGPPLPGIVADPRVDQRVGEIDREVDEAIRGRDQEAPALDDGNVAREDGRDDELSQALAREERLHDDAAAQQQTELEPHERDDRDQRVPE